MNNFGKKLWLGALLKPQCWLCAAVDHQIISGIVVMLLFFLLGLTSGGFIIAGALFFFCILLVITPKRIFKLQITDKVLEICIFEADFFRRHKKDPRRKCSIMRVIAKHRDGTSEVIIRGSKIYGYDNNIKEFGIFLFKPYLATWSIIKDGYESGLELGRKLKDYIFAEKSSNGKTILHFLHHYTIITQEVTNVDIEPHTIFNMNDAKFSPITETPHTGIDAQTAHGPLLLTYEDKNHISLYKCCFTAQGVPIVFQITSSWLHIEKNGKLLTYTQDKQEQTSSKQKRFILKQ